MGTYDTVVAPCPKCGTESDFQSKSGECLLAVYELALAPADVLEDVNRHAPNTCSKCGTVFYVDFALAPDKVLHARTVQVDPDNPAVIP